MLFDQLPTGVVALQLAISCAIKHTAVRRFTHTDWYKQMLRSDLWYFAALITCVGGSLLTYLFFGQIVAWSWALRFAGVDFAIHLSTGTYAHYSGLLDMARPQYLRRIITIRILHAVAYACYIWLGLSHGR